MIECTIQRQHGLKNQKEIYDFLEGYGLKVLLIAREDANGIHDTHFHVLCENDESEIDIFTHVTGIIFRAVRDLDATLVYFTKEGKYSTFNGFNVNLANKPKIDMKQVIDDINDGASYTDLVYKYGLPIVKHSYGILALIYEMQDNKRKGGSK